MKSNPSGAPSTSVPDLRNIFLAYRALRRPFVRPIATYYTCAESLLDHYEVDQMGPIQQAGLGDVINPLLAGASTGLLYKSTGKILMPGERGRWGTG